MAAPLPTWVLASPQAQQLLAAIYDENPWAYVTRRGVPFGETRYAGANARALRAIYNRLLNQLWETDSDAAHEMVLGGSADALIAEVLNGRVELPAGRIAA